MRMARKCEMHASSCGVVKHIRPVAQQEYKILTYTRRQRGIKALWKEFGGDPPEKAWVVDPTHKKRLAASCNSNSIIDQKSNR